MRARKNKVCSNDYSRMIRGLYLSLLEREPDKPGMDYWLEKLESGCTLDDVASAIITGAEYQQLSNQTSRIEKIDFIMAEVSKWVKKTLSLSPITIVDICAQNTVSEQLYHSFNEWEIPHHIISIDPFDEKQNEINSTRKTTFLNDFVHDGKEHIFYLNEPDNTSAFLPLNRAVLDRLNYKKQFTTVKTNSVLTKTLDEVVKNIQHIDFLKLNVQELGLSSLHHAKEALQKTEIIHCDVTFMELYEGQAYFSEVEQFFRENNFDFIDLQNQQEFAYDSSFSWSYDLLGKAEAIFFKRPNNPSTRELISQALTALFIYRKISLADWLIKQIVPCEHPLVEIFENN